MSTPISELLNNDNVKLKQKNNVNVNNVEYIADKLVEKFSSPISRPFYCLVAYKLPEGTIWNYYEQAQSGRNPAGLFNWLCQRAIKNPSVADEGSAGASQ